MVPHFIQKALFLLHIDVPGLLHTIFFNQLLLWVILLRIRGKAVNIVYSTEQDIFRRIIFPYKFLVKIKKFLCIRVIKAIQRNQFHVSLF